MTSTVTAATSAYLSHVTYDRLSTGIGLAAIAALIVLLLLRELVSIGRERPAPAVIRALDMAAAPLLVVFSIVIVGRLVDLLK